MGKKIFKKKLKKSRLTYKTSGSALFATICDLDDPEPVVWAPYKAHWSSSFRKPEGLRWSSTICDLDDREHVVWAIYNAHW
jgi:hypothetical protein